MSSLRNGEALRKVQMPVEVRITNWCPLLFGEHVCRIVNPFVGKTVEVNEAVEFARRPFDSEIAPF